MNVTVSFHGISHRSSEQRLREVLAAQARRIERRLGSFNPDLVRFEGHIEKNPNHHLYGVSLRLKLPTEVLATAAEGHDLKAVITEALDDLERRLDKHLARLRGAFARKREDSLRDMRVAAL